MCCQSSNRGVDHFTLKPLPNLVEKMVTLFPLHKDFIRRQAYFLGVLPKMDSLETPELLVEKMKLQFPKYKNNIEQEKITLQKVLRLHPSLDEVAAIGQAFITRVLGGDISNYTEETAIPLPNTILLRMNYHNTFVKTSMFFLAKRLVQLNKNPFLLKKFSETTVLFIFERQLKMWEGYSIDENNYISDYNMEFGRPLLQKLANPICKALLQKQLEAEQAMTLSNQVTVGDIVLMRSPIFEKSVLLEALINEIIYQESLFLFKKPENCSMSEDEFRARCTRNLVEIFLTVS